MLKYLYLTATAVFIPLTMQIGLSATPPRVNRSEIVEPLCQMQTANGRSLDLSKICGKKSVESRVCVTISDPERKAAFAEYYRNNQQAQANLGCYAPPPPKYMPTDGSTPG